jgi:hypothetical protein
VGKFKDDKREDVEWQGTTLKDTGIREILVDLAGENEEVWPQRSLYSQLSTLREAYRGEELDLSRKLGDLTEDPRWLFLFQIIRDEALWTALLQVATEDETSPEERIRRIILLAAKVQIFLGEPDAEWFLPLPGPDAADDHIKICPS